MGVWNKNGVRKSRWCGTRCTTLIQHVTFFNKALSMESNCSQTNNIRINKQSPTNSRVMVLPFVEPAKKVFCLEVL